MHEMAIVEDLIALCEKNAQANGAEKIKEIHIKVGKLSGVEAHYLKSCYDVFKEGTICADATLEICLQELVIRCDECKFEGVLEQNHFICPKCKSENIKVTDGEELYLMRLVMD